MEPQQVLKATVKAGGSFGNGETFYAKMNRDGRIAIPKLDLSCCRARMMRKVLWALFLKCNLNPLS